MSEREGLATTEGVDQGSAAQTVEGQADPGGGQSGAVSAQDGSPAPDVDQQVSAASPGPLAADVPHHVEPGGGAAGSGGEDGLLGEPPRGAPVDDVQAAGPVDMESEDSRGARGAGGTGQQYSVGEG